MVHFYFREIAIEHLSNRGVFLPSKEVISYPFNKENRLKEVWRGMYMFKTSNPKEGDQQFGDFYMEIDEEDFLTLKDMTITITDYLFNKYKLKHYHFNFFVTNRSIWISIPTKVFNCYGMKNLHKVHRKMAEEVNSMLLDSGFNKGIDMSIYRWNGLMRALGSYLPKSRRWVTKFSLSDLEDSYSFEELSKSKFDNGFTYSDLEPTKEAIQWFKNSVRKVFGPSKTKRKTEKVLNYTHKGMEKFIEEGELSFNRNLHVYSMSLYLKDKGLGLVETIQLLQEKFNNPYLKTNEAIRTIHSAYRGDKHFSPKIAQAYLDESIFEEEYEVKKNTFIVPRMFIEKLHNMKAHYKSYKHLFNILYTYQVHKKDFELDISNFKYKKQELRYFQKLEEAGFISYVYKDDLIKVRLVHQPREVYQSYIVVPNQFLTSKVFRDMKREFIVLAELWRGSFKTSEDKFTYFFNTKIETIMMNVRMLRNTVNKYLSRLKKLRVIVRSFILPTISKGERKSILKRLIPKKSRMFLSFSLFNASFETGLVYPYFITLLNPFSLIIKCNYST